MKQEKSILALEQFLPKGSFPLVAPFFSDHTIHLTLTHERKSVLGDYRNPTKTEPHRISVNINLNPYNFLITLLHELAHMHTYNLYKHTVSPHGDEWKQEFRKILVPFIKEKIFPADVTAALMAYLKNPAASTCTDAGLYRALYRYDQKKEGHCLVEEVPMHRKFATDDGNVYVKLEKVRTRHKAMHVQTKRMFLFSGISDVRLLPEEPKL
ncbi:MAG: hypothetical protein EBZ77_03065 [Chitinophagia bacterium]|nr:hypothetical protein [Chitinophagia bacterium]